MSSNTSSGSQNSTSRRTATNIKKAGIFKQLLNDTPRPSNVSKTEHSAAAIEKKATPTSTKESAKHSHSNNKEGVKSKKANDESKWGIKGGSSDYIDFN